jgi:hypothetical protein
MEPFRVDPKAPVEAMKTYGLRAPLATHFREATCEQAGCPAFQNGWRTVIDERTDLGQRQARYIRKESGRRFEAMWEGGLTVFLFEAGQRCFGRHHMPLDREPTYLVLGGDWRGNPTGERRVHQRGEDWRDDMSTSLDATRRRQERG